MSKRQRTKDSKIFGSKSKTKAPAIKNFDSKSKTKAPATEKFDSESETEAPAAKKPKTCSAEAKTPIEHKAPPTFLSIPLELRQKIIFYALEPEDGLDPDKKKQEQERFMTCGWEWASESERSLPEQVLDAQMEYCLEMHAFAEVMTEAYPEIEDEMEFSLRKAEKAWGLDEEEALEAAKDAGRQLEEEMWMEYFGEA
ncbi:hypothetical protein Vi05172_g11180 [Venturia inaequalis]|nr:hypothetical protein Vi05172_g11180 [Venturia inaequalis]